jgi:hypothetical protein
MYYNNESLNMKFPQFSKDNPDIILRLCLSRKSVPKEAFNVKPLCIGFSYNIDKKNDKCTEYREIEKEVLFNRTHLINNLPFDNYDLLLENPVLVLNFVNECENSSLNEKNVDYIEYSKALEYIRNKNKDSPKPIKLCHNITSEFESFDSDSDIIVKGYEDKLEENKIEDNAFYETLEFSDNYWNNYNFGDIKLENNYLDINDDDGYSDDRYSETTPDYSSYDYYSESWFNY